MSNTYLLVDVDECAVDNGGCCKNAVCINTPHSYYCKCKRGYVGDGFTCDRQQQQQQQPQDVMFRLNLRELRANENAGQTRSYSCLLL